MAAKDIQVIGPYAPTDFSGAGNNGTLSVAMTADIEGLDSYDGDKVISVEPIVVLGNVFLIVYQKP